MCHDRHVTSALIYIVVMALVAAVVFLLAALVFGRGEELAPLPPGASPVSYTHLTLPTTERV